MARTSRPSSETSGSTDLPVSLARRGVRFAPQDVRSRVLNVDEDDRTSRRIDETFDSISEGAAPIPWRFGGIPRSGTRSGTSPGARRTADVPVRRREKRHFPLRGTDDAMVAPPAPRESNEEESHHVHRQEEHQADRFEHHRRADDHRVRGDVEAPRLGRRHPREGDDPRRHPEAGQAPQGGGRGRSHDRRAGAPVRHHDGRALSPST